jgi:sugar/nucleoside kinase (ribokinase family)
MVFPPAMPSVDVLHVAPVARELSLREVLDSCAAAFVGVTAQGLLRHWDNQGRVVPGPLHDYSDVLARINAVVLSEAEAAIAGEFLAGLVRAGGIAVVTMGDRGGQARSPQGTSYYRAYRDVTLVDDTGAGDVFAASLFLELASGTRLSSALRFASAAAALSVTGIGSSRVATALEVRRFQGRSSAYRDGPRTPKHGT